MNISNNSSQNVSSDLPSIHWSIHSGDVLDGVGDELDDTTNISLYSLENNFEFDNSTSDNVSSDGEDQPPVALLNMHASTVRHQNVAGAIQILNAEDERLWPQSGSINSSVSSLASLRARIVDEEVDTGTVIIRTDIEPEAECSICLLNSSDSRLACGHQFHYDCARQWVVVYKKKFCPYCKQQI